MKYLISSVVALACTIVVSVTGEAGWSYEGQSASSDWSYGGKKDPKVWPKKYPLCGGKSQSPINIEGEIYDVPELRLHPTWIRYNEVPKSMSMTNNGHTLSLNSDGEKPYLKISNNKYMLDTLHFHWGTKNSEGSEHTIKGKRYPLEMHAVHKKVYTNNTVVEPPEVIVVAVLFEISTSRNPGLDNFLVYVPVTRSADTTISIKPFAWSDLIPQFNSRFYAYKGSLTTPPCAEIATFLIRKTIENISPSQMESFRQLLNDDGDDLSGNFRPLQQKNRRSILFVTP